MTLLPHALAAAFGLLLAHQERRFYSMSRAIAGLLVIDVAQLVVRAARVDVAERLAAIAAGRPVPQYEGLARASWAVDQSLALAWYVVLTWAIWRALPATDEAHPSGNGHDDQERPQAEVVTGCPGQDEHQQLESRHLTIMGALAVLASSALLFVIYPLVRGRPVEFASVVVFGVALAVQLVATTRYILHWRRPTVVSGVALVLVIGSLADAAGPWIFTRPVRDWYSGEPVGVLIWSVVGGCILWAIAKRRVC